MWKPPPSIGLTLVITCTDVDNEYTVEMVKNEVRNLVGIAPEVQRLSLLPRIAIKAEGSALFRHMPHAPKYKSLGVLVVNNKKRKLKLSDKRWTDANVLIGKVPLSEDPLFFGDERMELVNNDEFIVKCGVQPQDMIEMDIDGNLDALFFEISSLAFPFGDTPSLP